MKHFDSVSLPRPCPWAVGVLAASLFAAVSASALTVPSEEGESAKKETPCHHRLRDFFRTRSIPAQMATNRARLKNPQLSPSERADIAVSIARQAFSLGPNRFGEYAWFYIGNALEADPHHFGAHHLALRLSLFELEQGDESKRERAEAHLSLLLSHPEALGDVQAMAQLQAEAVHLEDPEVGLHLERWLAHTIGNLGDSPESLTHPEEGPLWLLRDTFGANGIPLPENFLQSIGFREADLVEMIFEVKKARISTLIQSGKELVAIAEVERLLNFAAHETGHLGSDQASLLVKEVIDLMVTFEEAEGNPVLQQWAAERVRRMALNPAQPGSGWIEYFLAGYIEDDTVTARSLFQFSYEQFRTWHVFADDNGHFAAHNVILASLRNYLAE